MFEKQNHFQEKPPIVLLWMSSLVQCMEACTGKKENERAWRWWQSWVRPSLFTAAPALHLGNYQYCCYSAITNATTVCFIYQFLHPLQLVTSQDPETSQRVRASVQNQQPDFYQQLRDVWDTDQVHNLCTRITVLLPGFAGAHVQSFTHEEDLLGMVNRQTHLERNQNMPWAGLDGLLSRCHWFGSGPV